MKKLDRIVVHIGQMKTGTTSLQLFMRSQSALLREQGIVYPVSADAGGLAAHHQFIARFRPENERAPIVTAALEFSEADVFRQFQECDSAHTGVLSSEMLIGQVRRGSEPFKKLDADLHEYADHVEYVAYVRSPVEGYRSRIHQALMYSALLPQPAATFSSADLIGFRDIFPDRFMVRAYPRKADGLSVVDDFLRNVLQTVVDAPREQSPKEFNRSFSAEANFLIQTAALQRMVTRPWMTARHDEDMNSLIAAIRRNQRQRNTIETPRYREGVLAFIHQALKSEIEVLKVEFGLEFNDPIPHETPVSPQDALAMRLLHNVFEVDHAGVIELRDSLLATSDLAGTAQAILQDTRLPEAP